MIILYLLLISILLVIGIVLAYRNNIDSYENGKKNAEKIILEARLGRLIHTINQMDEENSNIKILPGLTIVKWNLLNRHARDLPIRRLQTKCF
jgi:hypothetical protein